MMEPTRVDSFDLPADCDHDHVTIYENDNTDEPPYYAVPYELVNSWEDGTDHLMEPHNFTVTEEYREAVADLANMDIEDVKLRREFETFHAGEVDAI